MAVRRLWVPSGEAELETNGKGLLLGDDPQLALLLDGDELRRKPLGERKAALHKLVRRSNCGIQFVEREEGDGGEMFADVCKLGLEGIVCKRLDAPYRSGPARRAAGAGAAGHQRAAAAMRAARRH